MYCCWSYRHTRTRSHLRKFHFRSLRVHSTRVDAFSFPYRRMLEILDQSCQLVEKRNHYLTITSQQTLLKLQGLSLEVDLSNSVE